MPPDRRAPARLLAWTLAALAVPSAAPALSIAELSASDLAASAAAPLDLYVNAAPRGGVHVVLRDGDALVPVADLERAGLRGLAGRHEDVDGVAHVSLASLAPALQWELDERGLALRLTARPELLGTAAIDLRPTARPAGLELGGDASGFLNYSMQLRTDDRVTGFVEAGASQRGRLLYSSGQLLVDGSAARGLTSLTLDDVDGLRRVVVGDSFASSSALGGGLLLGGVSVAREYGLDPYLVRSPLPRMSGFASTPSTLDVYVNGVLTRQVALDPGGYDVTNLPVTTGAGNIRTELHDAFGRTQVLSWQYYYTPALLGRGLSDYSYSLGFRRLEFGRESFDYGRPVFVGRHRLGLRDELTVGGRLDGAADLVSGGVSTTVALPFGTIDHEVALSLDDSVLGAATSVGYSFTSRRFSGGALLRLLSDRYANASLRASEDRAGIQASVFAGAPVGRRVSLGLSWSLLDRRDAGLTHGVSGRVDLGLARGLTLGVTASTTRSPAAPWSHDVLATLSWAFAPLSVADVSVGDGGRASAGVQRGLPAGTGFGYRARGDLVDGSTDAGQASGVLQVQWEHGRYEVQYDRTTSVELGTATIAGGAVFVGDRFFLSRPVQEGYGLIRAGVPGIRGLAEGREIGRTDGRGDLLVPTLLPYYGNRLAIADRDIPIEYRIGATELLAAPTLRGGVVAEFAVRPLRAVEGELVTAAGGADVPPAFGELTVSVGGTAFSSPVGGDGRFYLEDVPAGRHDAEVAWSGGRCRVAIQIGEEAALAELGQLRCHPDVPVVVTSGAAAGAAAAPAPAPAAAAAAGSAAAPAAGSATAPAPAAGSATAPAPAAGSAAAAVTEAVTVTEAVAVAATGVDRVPETSDAQAPSPAPVGFGPASPGCPSCSVCFEVEVDRLSGDPSRCDERPTAVSEPFPGKAQAAKACLVVPDLSEECANCLRARLRRRCPSWGDQAPAPSR